MEKILVIIRKEKVTVLPNLGEDPENHWFYWGAGPYQWIQYAEETMWGLKDLARVATATESITIIDFRGYDE